MWQSGRSLGRGTSCVDRFRGESCQRNAKVGVSSVSTVDGRVSEIASASTRLAWENGIDKKKLFISTFATVEFSQEILAPRHIL